MGTSSRILLFFFFVHVPKTESEEKLSYIGKIILFVFIELIPVLSGDDHTILHHLSDSVTLFLCCCLLKMMKSHITAKNKIKCIAMPVVIAGWCMLQKKNVAYSNK